MFFYIVQNEVKKKIVLKIAEKTYKRKLVQIKILKRTSFLL